MLNLIILRHRLFACYDCQASYNCAKFNYPKTQGQSVVVNFKSYNCAKFNYPKTSQTQEDYQALSYNCAKFNYPKTLQEKPL